MDESARWAVTRRQSGRPIGDFQLVQGMLADSQTDLMAARGLVIEAARAYQAGEDRRTGPSCAKYFASEAVCRVADRAVLAALLRDSTLVPWYRCIYAPRTGGGV